MRFACCKTNRNPGPLGTITYEAARSLCAALTKAPTEGVSSPFPATIIAAPPFCSFSARCGVSVSFYVRGCCMNKAPKTQPPDEFWRLLDRVYVLFETSTPETQAEIEALILALQEAV